MNANKKLQKAARERMAITGEPYTTALERAKALHSDPEPAWTHMHPGGVQRGGPGPELDEAGQAVMERLSRLPALRGQRVYYFGRWMSGRPLTWELEGKGGIAWFGPTERNTSNPKSAWVVLSRSVPALAGVEEPLVAAAQLVELFGL